MVIADGQEVTALNSNAAWMSRTADTTAAGTITQSNTTDSSSSTTGALKTAGGVGIAKKLFVGTDINVAGSSSLLGLLVGNLVTDSSTTGTNATLPAPTRLITRLTNSSLISISDITAPSGVSFFILLNKTGNSIVIVNSDSASTDILTGTSNDISVENNGSIWLAYSTTDSRWLVIGGSGGGFDNAVEDDLTLSASDTIAISTASNYQTFRVQGASASVTLSSTPFGASPPPDGSFIMLFGNHDTNTVIIPQSDVADGCFMDGDVELAKGQSVTFMYSGTLDRYIRTARS